MNYYIADLHFGHNNVLAYDNRPFTTIKEHDEAIINNWNNTVNINDDVYILGDISWYNVTETIKILEGLNGRKHLLIGNHDKAFLKNGLFRKQFVDIRDYDEIRDGGNEVVISHWPINCYNRHYYGAIHLYGHLHNSFEENMTQYFQKLMRDLYSKPSRMYNVGVMMPEINYTPRTLEEILEAYNDPNSKCVKEG